MTRNWKKRGETWQQFASKGQRFRQAKATTKIRRPSSDVLPQTIIIVGRGRLELAEQASC
jgi:hypothetical protein